MSKLTRQATIGAGGRFATLEAAQDYYAQYNMRLVSYENGCAEFAARAIETQAESWDGRSFHEVFTANFKLDANTPASPKPKAKRKRKDTKKPRTYYRTMVCVVCNGERDPRLTQALCRRCYNARKRDQRAQKKGAA